MHVSAEGNADGRLSVSVLWSFFELSLKQSDDLRRQVDFDSKISRVTRSQDHQKLSDVWIVVSLMVAELEDVRL